ncbi:hypothetical protein K0T92_06555 [Paenibacillus oenotherae]|uniref:Uncharacterized protein n=1 Tax=Paenibacillus oenotherae TaxID=1435645 RepID=A0ABS7D389_9BACL|nr:hypothetical protein [Paenibacillus oenotherae]MBW7474400.1 hypothetical protein [Paenibacillus oenotherae]
MIRRAIFSLAKDSLAAGYLAVKLFCSKAVLQQQSYLAVKLICNKAVLQQSYLAVKLFCNKAV